MILERVFQVTESESVWLPRINAYLQGIGFWPDPERHGEFKRGSILGATLSWLPKHWSARLKVECQPVALDAFRISALLDVNTQYQIVLKRERLFLDKEMDGLVDAAGGIPVPISASDYLNQQIKLREQVRGLANWFYSIAGLSLVNSAISLFGGNVTFVIGLGATLIVDATANAHAQGLPAMEALVLKLAAFVIGLLIAAIFFMFGRVAQHHPWISLPGIVLYALDGVIFMVVGDFLSVAFHLFVLFNLIKGWYEVRELRQAKQE